jgi:hypothetical protein
MFEKWDMVSIPGGLITSTALTLFVLPAICGLVLRRRAARAKKPSDGIEAQYARYAD